MIRGERSARKKPKLGLQVEVLPPKPDDPDFVKSLNETPGILALAMKKKVGPDGKTTFEGLPFVVPGARFNEVCNERIDKDIAGADRNDYSSITGTRTSPVWVSWLTESETWP